jgi:DNA-binding NtrC family response regulator
MSSRWILVIDDSPDICEDFRKILQRNTHASSLLEARATLFEDAPLDEAPEEGFEVDYADQGQTGLAMVQSALQRGSPYAVAFIDMLMPPGWDGLETVDHLWSVDPELEIVICTAFTDIVRDRLPQRFEHSDKLLILRKPFDNIEVWQLASVLTRKRYLEQQVKRQLASRTQGAAMPSHALLEALRQVLSALEQLTQRYRGHSDTAADACMAQAMASATRMQELMQGWSTTPSQ